MKLRIEIDPDTPEEVVIKTKSINDTVKKIQEAISGVINKSSALAVKNGDSECYIEYDEFLFFETSDDKVWAHTKNECFLCPLRLNELMELLPRKFARASKSSLVNTAHIRSLARSPTGIAKASFNSSEKTIYISRMYFKTVRATIEETRLM